MNEEIVRRLQVFRDTQGYSVAEFAARIDLEQPFCTQYGVLADRMAELVREFPELQIGWVLFGVGPMLRGE